ncbi:MAG TPA: carboxypeptidase-like regulatory domain-containing protein [Puia sp.]|nr:carboxypeptidase-like regulatory domain-containing protein [Puia sp.]
MTKFLFLYLGACSTSLAFSQPSFRATVSAGVLFPVNTGGTSATYNSAGVHFGDHLDCLFGNGPLRAGIGGYLGQLSAVGENDNYKTMGQDIARKAGLSPANLVYSGNGFSSTQFLLGPVLSWKKNNLGIDIWAKGGYGLNEPGTYSVLYKANGTTNNVYVGQSGDNKDNLAVDLGASMIFAVSQQIGLQIGASYASTKTSQVNYNFLREKGITPLFYTATNQFVKASVGLQFHIGRENAGMRNGRSYAGAGDWSGHDTSGMPVNAQARGRVEEDRKKIYADRTTQPVHEANGGRNNDSLFFIPSVVELKSEPRPSDLGMSRALLQTSNNYLTAFACHTSDGTIIGQCSGSEMPGEPIPGIDVRMKRMDATGNDMQTTRTNGDGSFAYNAIAPGNYNAIIGADTIALAIRANQSGPYRLLDVPSGDCSETTINYVITVNDKQYVEVTGPREAGTGMASGREASTGLATGREIKPRDPSSGLPTGREIKPRDPSSGLPTGRRINTPLMVVNTGFEINGSNIIRNDGKLYAEVISIRGAQSGHASGRGALITGDVDGDGFPDYPADADEIHHLHKEGIVHRDLAARSMLTTPQGNSTDDVVSPLYQGGGHEGLNPLFEPKDKLRVLGSTGSVHTIILPESFQVPGGQAGITPFQEYKIGPVKYMSPESISSRGIQEKGIRRNEEPAAKGISEKGIKKNEAAGKGITEKGIKKYDDAPAAKGISEKGIKRSEATANGALFLIKSTSRLHCADGTCVADAVVETGGNEYDAVITGVMQR